MATPRVEAAAPLPAEPRAQPEWCVDHAGVIAPMTSAELRAALDRGALPSEARAWRLGMECWLPVAAIAELTGAHCCELLPTPHPGALLEGLGPETLDALTPRISTLNAEAKTPAPAFRTRERTFGGASSQGREARRNRIAALQSLVAVRRALTPLTLGSAVGAAAIALAAASLLAPAPSPPPASPARSVAPLVSDVAARAVELAPHEHAPAARAEAPSTLPLARSNRRPARDPGQRRLRVGARP